MILVDSSVWIDYFRARRTPQVDKLDALIGRDTVLTGDLILAEVLQGCDRTSDFNRVLSVFRVLPTITIGSNAIAVQAARNYRTLRAMGVTVRKTIDSLIATRCIEEDLPLLHSDRDFDAFVSHLGLRDAMSLV